MTDPNNQLSDTDHNVGSSNKSDNKDTSEEKKAAIMSIFQNIIPKNKRRREEDGIADIQEIFRHKFKKAVGRYRMDYPIFHRRNPDMTSFKRPSSTIAAIPNRDSFTVSVDDKREWPVYDHRRMPPINRTRIARTPHLAADPDFKIVLPEKPTLQPPKVYPPSRGLKLKSVENCMKQIPVPVEPPVSSSSSSSSLAKPVVTYDSNFVQSFLGSIKSITEQQEAARRNPNDNRQRSKLDDDDDDDDDDAEDAYTSKLPYSTSEDPRDSLEEMSQDGMEGYNDEIYDTQFTPGTSDKLRSESCSSGSDTNDQTDNQDILSSDRHVTVDEYIDYLTEHGVDAKTIAQALVEDRHLLHDGDDMEDNDYEPLMETLKFIYQDDSHYNGSFPEIPELFLDIDMNMPTSNTTTEKKSTEEELVPSGSLLKHIDPKSSSPQVKKVSSASYRERIIKRKKSVELEEGETVTPSPSPPREVNLDTEEVKIPHPTPPTVNVLATSKNADTEQEQLVYTRLLKRLATAYKTRAGKSSSINSLVDHMFAFCNYVISYYYMDRLHANTPFTEAIKGWRSLFPYVETFMKQIQEKKEHTLYGLCCCLMSLIRFYLFRRLEKLTKPDLAAYSNDQESATQAKDLITRSDELLKEYEKGHYLFSNSEKFFNIGVLAKAFPKSFESIVVQGDLSLGVTLNGEAGVKTAPMYPFSPFSSLRHAAIAIKVILVEFIESRNLEFKLLKDPEDYL